MEELTQDWCMSDDYTNQFEFKQRELAQTTEPSCRISQQFIQDLLKSLPVAIQDASTIADNVRLEVFKNRIFYALAYESSTLSDKSFGKGLCKSANQLKNTADLLALDDPRMFLAIYSRARTIAENEPEFGEDQFAIMTRIYSFSKELNWAAQFLEKAGESLQARNTKPRWLETERRVFRRTFAIGLGKIYSQAFGKPTSISKSQHEITGSLGPWAHFYLSIGQKCFGDIFHNLAETLTDANHTVKQNRGGKA